MNAPLVSIICLCYNHKRFLRESIDSVLNQSYPNIEVIVVDDASTDGSQELIRAIINQHPKIRYIELSSNIGNTAAFNHGWRACKGEFIIDLATDDVLEPDRVELGVKAFLERDPSWGVQYGNAEFIDEQGNRLRLHSDRFAHASNPVGDVYAEVIRRFFINSVTIMARRNVFERLNGYDETLAYEDFDFWVRASREFKFFYSPDILAKRRIVRDSMSKRQFERGNKQQLSTYHILQKAKALNKTEEERKAWRERVRYEIRQAFMRGDLKLAWRYLKG